MKAKTYLKWASIFFLVSVSAAQNPATTVTGTFQDPNGQVFFRGTYSISFVPTPGNPGPYTQNGVPFPVGPFKGNLDATGSINLPATLADNSTIAPAGSRWGFTICPNASSPCTQVSIALSGATQDISTVVNSNIRPIAVNASPIFSKAYTNNEVTPATDGSSYFDVLSNCVKMYYQNIWSCLTGSGGGGSGIRSINGDVTPAQTIVGGTGISVSTVAGATTITNTGSGTGGGGGNPATSPFTILSVDGTQNLVMTVPNTGAGNPTIVSSTGTLNISNLFVSDLAGTGTSCLQADPLGNVARSGLPCGTGTGGAGQITFQGVADAVKDSTCSTTVGSPNLSCTDAPFSPCPTGKTISVTDGLTSAAGEPNSLITTISSCTSSTVAVLATNATRATTGTTVRWGTDNGPAVSTLANASATAGQTLIIPPGNYLWNSVNNGILVFPNTAYVIKTGAHIYWIGPTGCSSNDTACPGTDSNNPMFYITDPTTSRPNGIHNVLIQIDGVIEGDNTDNNGVGVPYLNQSAVVAGVGTAGDGSNITDITINGSGILLNLYGFSFHNAGYSQRYNVRGLHHIHVAKGLNINGFKSDQSYNFFLNSAGIEAAGSNVTLIGNHFDNSWGISVGGLGGGAVCSGYVVSSNVFTNMTLENVLVSQCPTGAVISGNSFWMPTNTGTPHAALNLHDDTGGGDNTPTHDNLIVGNTFYAPPDPRGCYGAVFTYGTATGGNVFSQNHMTGACQFGYVLNGYFTGHTDIIKGDTLIGNSGADLVVGASNKTVLQGAFLAGTGTVSDPSNLLDPTSWYTSSNGQKHMGSVSTGPLQGSQLTVGPTQTHTSALRIVSSNSTSYLDIDAPATGNPTITSSTGNITVSKLTIPSMPNQSTIGTDASGNFIPGTGGSGSGMVWPSGNAGNIPAYSGASSWQTSYSPTNPIPANMIASTTPLTQMFSLPATYTVTATDFVNCVTFYSASGGSTVTLPTTIPPAGQCIKIVNYSTSGVIVNHGSYTLNGNSSVYTISAVPSGLGTFFTNSIRLTSDGASNMLLERFSTNIPFSAILGGNLTSQNITIGTGASLRPNASIAGVIDANSINGATVPVSQAVLASNPTGQLIASTIIGMTWPSGANGSVPNYNGASGWGTSYGPSNQFPSTFIPILNQNTTGNAATATALAGPTLTQCSSGQFSTGISTTGNSTCSAPTIPFSNIILGTNSGQTLYVGSGSILAPSASAGTVTANNLGNVSNALGGSSTTYAMPSTFTSGYLHFTGTALVWDTPTGGGGGTTSFSNITSGTNTGQTLTLGTGTTLTSSTGGSITPAASTGIVTANFLSAGAGTANGSFRMPTTFSTGYLQYDGTQLLWGTPISAGGGALSALTAATAANSINNSTFKQTWNWNFTGSTANAGLALGESTASTNALASLLQVGTLSGSAASPLTVTAGGTTNGFKMDPPTGNILTIGAAKFVGPVNLPGINNASILGTDGSGNIIGRSSAPPVYSQTTAATMSLSTGVLSISGTGCTANVCTMTTAPAGPPDSTYRLVAQVIQTSPGVGTCTTGTVQIQFSYTDADTGVALSNVGTLAMFRVLSSATLGGAIQFVNNIVNGAGSNYVAIPVEFRVQGGSVIKFQINQTIQASAGCTSPPQFIFRPALYGPLAY